MSACRCQFCARALEPAQELRFLVETDTLDNPIHLDRIRRLPATTDGKPLRVCKSCQTRMEQNPHRFRAAVEQDRVWRQARTGMLAAVGVLSLGWLLGTLLSGPRT